MGAGVKSTSHPANVKSSQLLRGSDILTSIKTFRFQVVQVAISKVN